MAEKPALTVAGPTTLVQSANVVAALEAMLAKAKAGEITAIGIAAVTYKSEAHTDFAGYNCIEMLGAISILRARVERYMGI
jgi:hypothetical protein